MVAVEHCVCGVKEEEMIGGGREVMDGMLLPRMNKCRQRVSSKLPR